ncbi:hypothetical protein V6R21_25420 [Limibacter armeniacum]|uniref:hypothetical protein n=1 Tax=Limibacter armeniacum TaxID=466084 RepID=UPI002FE60FCE
MRFLLLLFLFPFFSPPSDGDPWKGVLLIQQEADQYNIMIDQTEKLAGFELEVVKLNGEKEKFDLNSTGRIIGYNQVDDIKFIRVFKDGVPVSSVKKSDILFCQPKYMERRTEVMAKRDEINGNKVSTNPYTPEEALAATTEKKEEETASNKTSQSNPNTEEINDVQDNKRYYSGSSSHDREPQKEYDQIPATIDLKPLGTAEDLSLTEMLQLLEFKAIASEVKQEEENTIVLESVRQKKKVRKFSYNEDVDFGSWMILTHKKRGDYFFDGFDLFKFETDTNRVQLRDKASLPSFFADNKLYMKPVSEDLLGIYHQNMHLVTLQLSKSYSLAVVDNLLSISSKQHTYGLMLKDGQFVVVTYQDGVLDDNIQRADRVLLD